MTKRDILDALVVITGVLFFILLILSISGKPYLTETVIDLLFMMLLMRAAHREHLQHRKGRFNRAINERKFI
jgi:membrane protein CcdC involved in cytochrome C biogenesis